MLTTQITRTGFMFNLLISRHLQGGRVLQSAVQSPLFKLRQKTGLAYNLCREALNKHNDNLEEAEAWLKAQALAHGLQRATKVRDRSAREGLIGLAIKNHNRIATILELNCETDFVAKNQIFKEFALDLTEQVTSTLNGCTTHSIPGQESIEELRPSSDELKRIDGQIVPLITKLGENIRVRRLFHLQSTADDTKLFGQIHAQAAQKSCSDFNLLTGRFGAVVALKSLTMDPISTEAFTRVGNRLCQHVIGYNPTYIELPDNLRKHLEEAENERSKLKEVVGETDGTEEDAESDSEDNPSTHGNRDDWPSIMDQQLIMADDISVREFCKESQVSIIYFNRIECGET